MKRITSTDLLNWAPTRDCQEHLPLLIRRLIRASPITISKILIPAGDNVILPGYDGTVETVNGTEYIPTGQSVWEMGSGKDFEEKAEREFKKRSNEIAHSIATNISFVFVTPRVWNDKKAWIESKNDLNIWKEVLVIDGLILEEWIEQFPNVAAWLAKFLSTPFANIQPLDQFWEEWSKNITYSISSSLVVSGREKEIKLLNDFYNDNPQLLSIKASSIEEVIAFLAAVTEQLDPDLKEGVYSKAIIVENEQDFRILSASKNPMLLIAKFQSGSIVDHAVKNGHHVIVPIGYDVTASRADIELSRIRREGFQKGLENMGFTREESEHLTTNSGQSLSVLRRLLKYDKNYQPDWARNGHHVNIIPALMAGMWDELKEDDNAIISLFACEPYENYIAKLARWKLEKDAPVFQIKSYWRLTSALDAWSILAPLITKTNLDNFRTSFLTVLPEINPALELDPDKRYFASLYNKIPRFSHSLKEGLCQSLILMAVFGKEFGLKALQSPQEFADTLVHDLLFDANGDKWCTLYRLLPLLAEASPKSFLQAVDNSLTKKESPIIQMFGDFDNLLYSTNYHTGLLWALENLLISPDYLQKSTLVLAKLSRLDPGGKMSNRPINTLRDAYMPWYGQTRADFITRKNVLQRLTEQEPDIAWQLLLKVLPQHHSSVSPIHQCKWRFDAQHLERIVNQQEVWDFYSFVFEQLLRLAEGYEHKISELIEFYPNLDINNRKKLLQLLKDCRNTVEHKENMVCNELRKLLSHHREYPEQQWALPEEELKKIHEVFTLYSPEDIKEKYKYLFERDWSYFHEETTRNEMSIEQRNSFIESKRDRAFHEIYHNLGLNGVLEFVSTLENVFDIGKTAANANLSQQEEIKLFHLLSTDQSNKAVLFVQQYILFKGFALGLEWITEAYDKVKNIHTNSEILALFFLSLPQNRDAWNLLDATDKTISRIYWSKIHVRFYQEKLEDKLYLIKNLMEVNRHVSIIDHIAYVANDIPSELLADILLNAASTTQEDKTALTQHDVGKIFHLFYKRDDLDVEKLSQLEWIYLPFLADFNASQKPKSLLSKLTADPEFFVDVVAYVYMPDKGAIDEGYSQEELMKRYRVANSARHLLDSWRDIPGVKPDGTIDKNHLKDWIYKARAKAKTVNRVYGVDSQIGYLLACFPRNNSYWPPEEICEMIDFLNTDEVTSHFEMEIINSRGVYMKSAYGGGDQERALALYFEKMAKQIQPTYPVTASALFNLVEKYYKDAKDEDDRAHLDELR